MSLARVPEVGDLVTLEFDIVNGMADSHKGQVLSVDTEPEGLGNELFLEITDKPGNNTVIHYYEGSYEGEPDALVLRYSEFSSSTKIGENATLEVVA